MQRRYRIRRSSEFQRVRRQARSYAHPLVVLLVAPCETSAVPIGVTASRAVGNAVRRNRARRLLREAVRPCLPALRPGCELILMARPALVEAPFAEVCQAVQGLLRQSGLLGNDHGNTSPPGRA